MNTATVTGTGSGGALVLREGDREIEQYGSNVAAAAEAARAEIESRMSFAQRFPRNVDAFRTKILKDCMRPGFAEAALYRKPVGKNKNPVTGKWEDAFAVNFSVRFIESAIRHFKHVHVIARITSESEVSATLTVGVLDAEDNISYTFDASIPKLVERRDGRGRDVQRQRTNSQGEQVFVVSATPEEFKLKMAAERSKLLRDNGQRLIPSDILAECREQIEATLADEHAKDPDAAKKKVLDRFASIGVTPDMLRVYLGHTLDALAARDIAELAVIFTSLKDGDCTWDDVVRMKTAPAEGEAEQQPDPKADPLKEKVMAARDKVRASATAPADVKEGETK